MDRDNSMGYILTGTMLILLTVTASNTSAQSEGHLLGKVGLIYPWSSNGVYASPDTNVISFNGMASLSAASLGVTFAEMSNTDCVESAQVAGHFNRAKWTIGMPVEFTNLADSTGTKKGVINVAKNSKKSIGLSLDETQTVMLSYRLGGRIFYGIIGVGYHFNNRTQKYAYQAGVGARLLNYDKFRLKTELIASGLENFKGRKYFKSSSYLMPAFKLGKRFELFAGPSFNSIVTDTEEGKGLIKYYISTWTSNNGRDFHGIYFGYTAGLQLNL